jgi:hypothetical protein
MLDLPTKPPAQEIVQKVQPPKADPHVTFGKAAAKNDDTYEKLHCSQADRENIHEIITTLAENGKLGLLFKQGHLKHLGSQLGHLHPLKLLSVIFTTPELKAHMGDIFKDYFKRNGFMDGIGPSLSSKAAEGKLNQYIDKFAQEIKVPVAKIRPFFEKQDWEGLIEFLING